MKIVTSSPITSWQIDGERVETVSDFFFGGGGGAPKSLQMVTAAKKLRHLLLGQKAMTNLDSIFKSRDITLPTKVHLVKAMVFLSCMDVRVEPQIKLNTEELMLLNCSVGEDS